VINLHGKVRTKKQRNADIIQKFPFLPTSVRNKLEWDKHNDFFVEQLRDYFQFCQPDVAISLMPPANTPTLMAAAGTRVKVVASNHNVPKEDYESPLRWDQNPVDRKLRLSTLDNASAIHVLFPRFGAWFPERLQEKVVSIPNYISPEFMDASYSADREKLVLAVGRLVEVKNYLQLIRSWNLVKNDFPDWKVIIYGTGPQLSQLKDKISELGLQGVIRLAGHRTDLGPEYARASIFCHPAHFEGFGLSPAEALHMGVPVVAFSDCPGVNEFVKHELNGLMVDREAGDQGLAAALKKLMANQSTRENLGRNGPSSISEFTLERYRDNWLSLIEKLTTETV
jgi:glycosyltransferase involved in cell wall biosynthesis